jgi:tetratricopeptide (TPR) repeat protein
MRKILFAIFFLLTSSLALALPSPKEIDAAVRAGQLTQAETMLRAVLLEKPNSAKAHYELGQVLAFQGRNADAREALQTAQKLDPKLHFANNPQHFHELMNRVAAPAATLKAAPTPARTPLAALPAATAPATPDFPWSWLLIGGGVLLAAIWLLRRTASTAASAPLAANAGGGTLAQPYGYNGSASAPTAGSGVGGAVLGGLAGLAAGYGLAKVLEHGNDTHPAGGATGSNDSGFVPIDTGASADYGSFDAGSGDGWDSSEVSSDDSW